jgi:hypothetical protein
VSFFPPELKWEGGCEPVVEVGDRVLIKGSITVLTLLVVAMGS